MPSKHGPWTVEATVQKHRDSFLTVREDRVIRPDGQPGTYTTVTMKPGVAVLPFDEQGTVYLTRQFRYAVGRESIEAACGGIDEGEKPRDAARRELREELGIEAAEWIDLGHFDLDTSMINGPVHLFVAKRLSFTETEREGTETIESLKLPFKTVVTMILNGEITHGAELRAGDEGSARRGRLSGVLRCPVETPRSLHCRVEFG